MPQGDPLKRQSSACSEQDSIPVHPPTSLQAQLLELSSGCLEILPPFFVLISNWVDFPAPLLMS